MATSTVITNNSPHRQPPGPEIGHRLTHRGMDSRADLRCPGPPSPSGRAASLLSGLVRLDSAAAPTRHGGRFGES